MFNMCFYKKIKKKKKYYICNLIQRVFWGFLQLGDSTGNNESLKLLMAFYRRCFHGLKMVENYENLIHTSLCCSLNCRNYYYLDVGFAFLFYFINLFSYSVLPVVDMGWGKKYNITSCSSETI